MKIYSIIFTVILLIIFTLGCSDKQKDADKLEQEMLQMEADSLDSLASDSMMADSSYDSIKSATDAMAVPEEESLELTMPQRPESDGYIVQVASCEDSDYAHYLTEIYTKRGYEPFVTTHVEEGTVYYRVRLGVYDTMSEAKAMQAELKDKFSLETWVDLN